MDAIDASAVIARLQAYRWTGRQGYSLKALFRAYAASFLLNLPHTNALIRELQDNPELRNLCGFGHALPHRTTFNRFIQRLSHHADLVEACFVQVVEDLKTYLPGLGQGIAVDSTTVRTHSNPKRKKISDPEATPTQKNSAKAVKGDKEWHFGYKLHLLVDANYGVPVGQTVTTASRNDSPELPIVFEKTKALLPWFCPRVVIGDKGYDSAANHSYLQQHDAIPVIAIRKLPKGELHKGLYTDKGTLTCFGQAPMEYVRSDPQLGRLYRCRTGGCHLVNSFKGGTRYCNDWAWVDPTEDLRLFGVLRRDAPEWREVYRKRQAVERTFKSMKESRRLERHCIRGLRQITLHSYMSVLTFVITSLIALRRGQFDYLRWMVRQVP